MSGPFGSSQWMYSSGAAFYPTEIEQSLRFNDNDSAYLSRTPASAGNRKTWTWSGWVKRGNLGQMSILGLSSGAAFIRFNSSNQLEIFYDTIAARRVSNAVFRDASAWYHINVILDTTNGTDLLRGRAWVNGVELTWSSTRSITLNADYLINGAVAHEIGRYGSGLFDGYMAEINFIDGQALDPTDFGEFKSGVWVAKEYTGSYGTNGFYLNFSDSANIGDDLSGNANDWTANNLVATDVVLDSPTQNWCVWNAVFDARSGAEVFSEGNLKWRNTSGSVSSCGTGTFLASGKIYFEAYLETVGTDAHIGFGRADETNKLLAPGGSANDGTFVYACQSGSFYNGATPDTGPSTVSAGSVVSVAYDQATGKTWFAVNGTWYNSGDPASGTNASFTISSSFIDKLVPLVGGYNNVRWVANFGQDSSFAGNKTAQGNTDDNGVGDFYYAPPSGYLALCAANLPDPAIDPAQDESPADYFNTVLYTGNGTAQSITGVSHQPDWVWIKARAGATESNQLFDAVRGATLSISSNSTNAEITNTQRLTSFDVDGFSVGNSAGVNTSGVSYVAWNWLAGNGTSSNTDGSITSTVSVNQKAGFSIVSYTGNGTAGATVGHGLGAVPDMLIVKNRDLGINSWWVYHSSNTSAPETDFLALNATSATSDNNTVWNDTTPTANVFTLGNANNGNANGTDIICYAFAEVEGYSKFGSFVGNGSTDGTFVYTGFEVAWLMVKRTNSTSDWTILDNLREGYNVDNDPLFANLSNAESTTDLIDLLSNGFKLRSTSSSVNASGSTYIYAAFAKNPFKYANAR